MSKLLINDSNKLLVGSNGKAYAVRNLDVLKGSTSPVDFTAAAGRILRLMRYGKCEQSGTPTPSAPVDIVCNNGAIKARRQSGLPLGYQMVEWLRPTGSIPITGFKTKSTQEITTVFYRERSGASYLYSSDTNTSGTTNTTAYLTSGSGNWRWDGKSYSIAVSFGIQFTSIQNKNGVWLNGTKYGSYTGPGDFVSANDLRLSSNENTTVRIYSMTIREGDTVTLDLVPVQRLSDNAYGFYDKVSGNFYTNAEATITAGDPIADPVEIYTGGTPEVLMVNGQTASVANLLQVGDYKDEQDIISGLLTHKIGIKVLTGDNTKDGAWGTSAGASNLYYLTIAGSSTDNAFSPISTHFVGVRGNVGYASIQDGQFKHGSNSNIYYFKDASSEDVTSFKAFLAAQYAAGTPVIVLYPLAAETTENVTPQPLNTVAGQNTLTDTANVSNPEYNLIYKI